MNTSVVLLEQIIQMAEVQAKQLDAYHLANHKATKTLGENSVVFHLRILKDLLLEEASQPTKVVLAGKVMEVALGEDK